MLREQVWCGQDWGWGRSGRKGQGCVDGYDPAGVDWVRLFWGWAARGRGEREAKGELSCSSFWVGRASLLSDLCCEMVGGFRGGLGWD